MKMASSSTSSLSRSLRSERQTLHSSSSNLRNSTNGGNAGHPPARSKVPSSRRSVTPHSRSSSTSDDQVDLSRVRVSVRLRPRNAEDLQFDADFADCVEQQPELKRLKLRKNNWSFESYKFDEVFTGSASQKRVYEVVAKPVVESVLNGYNGTVMAYGQTGTGKTYTVGRMGKDDPSERGIMVRAMEDIIASRSSPSDTVEVSYLQLYLESLQDLLMPEKNNIPIVEDPKTGEVALTGATVIKVCDLDHFLQLLQIGEANRHAANTKMNTESSRSHAILLVYIQKSSQGKLENRVAPLEHNPKNDIHVGNIPTVLRSKLLIVDLAGSERLDKSGSEGHMLEEAKFINLSLTSLGKCINALAENSPHIPTRDSKLTRLLRDSFGGSARTSLIITIGPSARHHAETASTIMFGQRAMKVVNMVKLKEEFDYESLCRKLDNQVDFLTAEIERLQRLREHEKEETEKKLKDCQNSFAESEKSLNASYELLEEKNSRLHLELENALDELKFHKDHNDLMQNEVARLEISLKQSKQNHLENSTYQTLLADTTQMYEKKIARLIEQLEDERALSENAQEQLFVVNKILNDHQKTSQIQEKEIEDLKMKLRDMCDLRDKTVNDFRSLRTKNEELIAEKIQCQIEVDELKQKLQDMYQLHKSTEDELTLLRTEHDDLFSLKHHEKDDFDRLRTKLQESCELHEKTVHELQIQKLGNKDLLSEKGKQNEELRTMRQKLSDEVTQRKYLEEECLKLKKIVSDSGGDFVDKKSYLHNDISKVPPEIGSPTSLQKVCQSRETISGQRATIAKIFEEVGLEKIISMLSSDNVDVQIHAVKVIANLAAEDMNQMKIVEEGGLDSLLKLLGSSQNSTIHRVASGAIANLAMTGYTGDLIIDEREQEESLGVRLSSDSAISEECTFKLAPDISLLEASERDVIGRLISLGFYYRELDRFATKSRDLSWIRSPAESPLKQTTELLKGNPKKHSVYRRAIANGIVEILSIYRSAVLHVEQKLLSDPLPILATVTQGLNKFFVLLPHLHELIVEIERDDIRGGQLLNLLHKRCHCGVPELQACIKRQEDMDIANESTPPEMLDKSLRKSPDDASLADWHLGFHIFLGMLPDYIHMRVAEAILFAGKAVRVLRNPSPAFRCEDAASHLQISRGSYKLQGFAGRFASQKEFFVDTKMIGEELLPQSEADKIDAMLQELKESSEFHKRSFECVVDSVRAIAASHLWQLVVVRADLNGHLRALKDYFLLAKGDFFQCFLEESRQLMRLPPRQSTAEADLMVPFQLAAIKTISDEDKYFSRVSLRMPSFGITVTSSQPNLPKLRASIDGNSQGNASYEPSLDGWDGIALEYSVDWPLQLFFSQEVLSKYCKVFQYLLRLKRTQMELEKSWASVMHQDHTNFAKLRHDRTNCSISQQRRQGFSSMWRVREHMAFLIRNLQFYIQVDVIESQWNVLQASVQDSRDFTELVGFHQEYLSALISQSFLDIGSVSRILDSIMKLCLQFCWRIESDNVNASELQHVTEEFNKKSNSLYTILRSSRLAGSQRAPFLRRFLLRLNFNSFFETTARGALNVVRSRPTLPELH